MPRISAPTVAEHRARQREALVAAARAVAAERGPAAVTFAAVADRAGLARNTLYDYFPGRAELLLAVAQAEAPLWTADIARAMSAARTPKGVVRAFVTANLDLVAAGRHRVAAQFSEGLPAQLVPAVRELHAEVEQPLVDALRKLGKRDADRWAALVWGTVVAATRRIEAGDDPDAVARTTVSLLLDGLDS